jgi:DNA-binding IclR family transcriptional regulator
MRCPECGGTHARCTTCGTLFSTVQGPELVLDILSKATEPIKGTVLAGLSGYSVPGVYNVLARLIEQGCVEKAGKGKQRRGYRLVRVLQFPQQTQMKKAAA